MNKGQLLGNFLGNPEIVKMAAGLTEQQETELMAKLKGFLFIELSRYEYLRSGQGSGGCCGGSDRQTCCQDGTGNSPATLNLPPPEDTDWTLQTK